MIEVKSNELVKVIECESCVFKCVRLRHNQKSPASDLTRGSNRYLIEIAQGSCANSNKGEANELVQGQVH